MPLDDALSEKEAAYFNSRGAEATVPTRVPDVETISSEPGLGDAKRAAGKPAEEKPGADAGVREPSTEEKPAVTEPETEETEQQADAGEAGEHGDETETEEGDEEKTPGKGKVPHFVVKSLRDEKRSLEKKLEEERIELQKERGELAAARERLRIIDERSRADEETRRATATKQEDPEPDPEDTLEHLQWENRQFKRELEGQRAAAQESHQNQSVAWIQSTTQAMRVDFTRDHPDYEEAYKHIVGLQRRNAELMYPGDAEKQLQEVRLAEASIVMSCLERTPQGQIRFVRSPAKVLYEMAEAFGYAKPGGNGNGNGAAAEGTAPAKKAPAKAPPADLATQKARQEASRSLSGMTGAEGSAGMTVRKLLDMPPDQYNRFLKDYPAEFNELMGKNA